MAAMSDGNTAGESQPIHRITLLFAGCTKADINRVVTALHNRAHEHGGFVGMFVDQRELDLPGDEQ
jgi:hypothetical protein